MSTNPQPLPGASAVEVRNLSFFYGERKALNAVDFDVERGAIFGLLGPNGGGKSTLFRILATLLSPEEGSARVFGVDVAENPLEVRRSLGVVFQNQSLDRRLTAGENLRHQGRLYGLGGATLERRLTEALDLTGVADRRDDPVDALSGGLRQRVELAKALLHRPPLLLLDEPSTGVDPGVRLEFWKRLQDLRAAYGTTVLLTTHLLEEADKCDSLALLDRGVVVACGAPEELKSSIGGDVVALSGPDPTGLHAALLERFSIDGAVVDGAVRFEHESGPDMVAQLMRGLPHAVDSVAVSRPSLEDVFICLTGHAFGEGETPDNSPGR